MERIKKFSLITLFGPINMLNKNPLTKRSNKISSTSTPNKNKIKTDTEWRFILVGSDENIIYTNELLVKWKLEKVVADI